MTIAPTYNLLDEPWIPCLDSAGDTAMLSLTETLVRAHQLQALGGSSPLETAALTRLLLAVVHCAFPLADEKAWLTLRRTGQFEQIGIGDYLERWRQYFFLFHEERPFYQVPGLTLKTKPAAELTPEQSSYGAPRDLLEHRPSGFQEVVTNSAAARLLCRIQCYHLGGTISGDRKNGDPTSAAMAPLAPLMLVVPQGESLFETLLYSTFPASSLRARMPCTSEDRPAWEREPPYRPCRRLMSGWRDLLTWQSRRLLLRQDTAGVIEAVTIAGGFDLDTPEGFHEPMAAYRRSKKFGFLPVSLRPDRAVWRDTTALLHHAHSQKQGNNIAPLSVQAMARRFVRGTVERKAAMSLAVFGQANSQAKFLMARKEVLPIALCLMKDRDVVRRLSETFDETEDIARALVRAVRKHAEAACHTSDAKTLSGFVDSTNVRQRYWSAMKAPYDELLAGIEDDENMAIERHAKRRHRIALDELRQAVAGLGSGAAAMKGAAMAERQLRGVLAAIRKKGLEVDDV